MHETVDTDNLVGHEFANLFPMISGKQFDELVASIADPAIGMIEPIITFEGKILDGPNRYAAAQAAGVELDPKFHFKQFNGTEAEALAYVVTAIISSAGTFHLLKEPWPPLLSQLCNRAARAAAAPILQSRYSKPVKP
jgi:hypothetical protein